MIKIAFDIDDTITNSSKIIRKYILKYSNKYKDGELLTENLDIILRGFFNYDCVNEFFSDYSLEMSSLCELRKNAKKIINKLHDEGYEIYIITARSDEFYKDSYKFCKNYLDSKGIKYDKLITSQLYKIDTCKRENIDIMVDDGVDTCDNLNKNNIKAFLYTTDLNMDKDTISSRVNSWNEVYSEIHKIIDTIE